MSSNMSIFEVAEILRGHNDNKLNNKQFKTFTKDNFEGVLYVKVNGSSREVDLINRKISRVINIKDQKGEILSFSSIYELCESTGIKSRNYWRKHLLQKGYEIISVEEF